MRLLFVWFEETDKSVIGKFQMILELNSWARLSDKAYVIRTEKTAGEIRDQLKKHWGLDTKLFVVDMTESGWASFQIPSMITDAIKTWQKKIGDDYYD
jgi:hypothetical protein